MLEGLEFPYNECRSIPKSNPCSLNHSLTIDDYMAYINSTKYKYANDLNFRQTK